MSLKSFKLITTVYRKITLTSNYMNWQSLVPRSYKIGRESVLRIRLLTNESNKIKTDSLEK